jgi:propanediol dehydratase small subunit
MIPPEETGPTLSVQGAVDGTLGMSELRMRPEALRRQAELAEAGGNPQLGQNLRRAAELAVLPDTQVMRIYECLRPSRSSAGELAEVVRTLVEQDAPLCASLVQEAATAYARRGLLR